MLSMFHRFSAPTVQALAFAAVPLTLLMAAPTLAAGPEAEATTPLTRRNNLLAQEPTVETVLSFETETMAVRIFRRGSDLLMNLYNKTTDVVEVNGAPAELVPSTRDQTVYKSSQGEVERFARLNIRGETELEIVGANGSAVLKEPGFNALVGIPPGPTSLKGNNFAPGTGAIVLSAQAAKLRSQPRLGSEIVGSANRREIVEVIERVGNPEDGFIWYKVVYQDTTGWVRGDLLQAA
ncbi:MAG: SH3 domain-containing protein [Nodosilinea sp.]